jgi:O-antigen ligase
VAWSLTVASAFVALSFSGSRAGLVVYTLMMALFAFQALARRRIFALAVASAMLVGIPIGLYALADPATTQRMGLIFSESHQLDSAVNASIPHRYTMAVNSLHLIAEHPWLGVGSGDFVAEYKAINDQRSPAWIAPRNPHNQLLFTVVTTGVFGGLLLLAVWFAPPWLSRRWPDDGLRPLRIGLPVFYFVVCLSESYIWRTNTGLMFVLFSALLYGPGPREPMPAASNPPAPRH